MVNQLVLISDSSSAKQVTPSRFAAARNCPSVAAQRAARMHYRASPHGSRPASAMGLPDGRCLSKPRRRVHHLAVQRMQAHKFVFVQLDSKRRQRGIPLFGGNPPRPFLHQQSPSALRPAPVRTYHKSWPATVAVKPRLNLSSRTSSFTMMAESRYIVSARASRSARMISSADGPPMHRLFMQVIAHALKNFPRLGLCRADAAAPWAGRRS